jgi:hypothetical protein
MTAITAKCWRVGCIRGGTLKIAITVPMVIAASGNPVAAFCLILESGICTECSKAATFQNLIAREDYYRQDWELRRRGFLANWRQCQIHFIPLDFTGVIDGRFHKTELDALTVVADFEIINPTMIPVRLEVVDTAANNTGFPFREQAIIDTAGSAGRVSIYSSEDANPHALIGKVDYWLYERGSEGTKLIAIGHVISIPPGIPTLNGTAHTMASALEVGAITATSIGFQPEKDRQYECQSVSKVKVN